MLLRELHLLEIDQKPLEDAIAAAQSQLSSGGSSHTHDEAPTHDVRDDLRPLIEKFVLDGTKPEAAALKKDFDTPEKIQEAVGGLSSMKAILKRMQRSFSHGVHDLDMVKKVATAAKFRTATKYLDSLEVDVENPAGTLVRAYEPDVLEAITKNRQPILDAIMKVRTGENWTEERVKRVKQAAYKIPPNQMQIRQKVELYHALIGTLMLRMKRLLVEMQVLRKAAAPDNDDL